MANAAILQDKEGETLAPHAGNNKEGWEDGRLGDLKHPDGVNNIGLTATNRG